MSDVLALIPARSGSKGIPNKNFRPLAGIPPLKRAADVAFQVCRGPIVVSSDGPNLVMAGEIPVKLNGVTWLHAPAPLHTDTCPMIDVVQDALDRVPGPPDQIIVLLQPTQPLRQPKHITAAIALLQETQADSVVGVVEVPRHYHGDWQYGITHGVLYPAWDTDRRGTTPPTTRQELAPAYVRDGTVYAFYRKTVQQFGDIYGYERLPLIIPSEETCSLDTPQDWTEAERRLAGR